MASARDILLVVVLVASFAIGLFVINYAVGTTITQMLLNPTMNATPETVTALRATDTATDRLDYIVFGLFIGLSLALIITGYFLGSYPIFAFVYFLVIVIGVVIAAMLSNVWESVTTASIFGTTVTNFPITNHLLTYFPIYAAIVGFIGLIAMFAKPYFEGGNL